MIYLDYAADTPVNHKVLDSFSTISEKYYGNPNAKHSAGKQANRIIEESTAEIKEILECSDMEVIYTSGASEANNLAIKGVAKTYRENGKHIISTSLEHSSTSGSLTWLQSLGYEIDLVTVKKDGTVDIDHLKELLRNDTILVSIVYVDSELGVRQPVEKIGEILTNYPNCHFHVDATQAVGKIPINLDNMDLVTFSPHKFFGLKGMGVLLRNEHVILEPLIHGGISTSIYRSGTPVTAGAATTALALKLCYENSEEKFQLVKQKNEMLKSALKKYPLVHINSTHYSLPHFLNVSIKGVKAKTFQSMLSSYDVCVSTKSACSTENTPSRSVFAVTGNREQARSSWRISLCHLTEEIEIHEFLKIFDTCYSNLTYK
ncbi:cysteine desulfurase family protein [Acetobacterium sp.]|uniref:cysteine desulfurase family protein n=1 Tax=Acetobacterium sp. TaxID=1872094 RepID=UPI002F41CAFF